jgi:DNA-binding MarR family transcriptional regulator
MKKAKKVEMVEWLEGEAWEQADDISEVPKEHWEWFLGAHVGSVSMRNIAGMARKLLANLRVLRDQKGWGVIGLDSWGQTLNRFGLTQQQWEWLEAGEPVITDEDSVNQGIAKGKALSKQAADLVRTECITQTEAAERCGVSQPAVSKALKNITEGFDSNQEVIKVPPHLTSKESQADFRKLTPAGQDRVRQGEPLNRVAIAEGVRVKLSPLERIQAAFTKLSMNDREAFTKWLADQAH